MFRLLFHLLYWQLALLLGVLGSSFYLLFWMLLLFHLWTLMVRRRGCDTAGTERKNRDSEHRDESPHAGQRKNRFALRQ